MEDGPVSTSRTGDGDHQGMQVRDVDRLERLEDQAAEGDHVVGLDPPEEVLGHMQRQMSQVAGLDGALDLLPGQVQPGGTESGSGLRLVQLRQAHLHEEMGDRRRDLGPGLLEDPQGHEAEGIDLLEPPLGHLREPQTVIVTGVIGVLIVGEAVERVPEELLPLGFIEGQVLLQLAERPGVAGLVHSLRRLLGRGHAGFLRRLKYPWVRSAIACDASSCGPTGSPRPNRGQTPQHP